MSNACGVHDYPGLLSRDPLAVRRRLREYAESQPWNPLELVIPWDPHRTSNNVLRRVHWSERSRLFAAAKTLARAEWAKAGWPKAAGKVRVSFVVRRGRQMDPLNCLDGMKPIVDGLFVAGITPDDNARWLEIGSVRVESGKQWSAHPEIVVTVEEI